MRRSLMLAAALAALAVSPAYAQEYDGNARDTAVIEEAERDGSRRVADDVAVLADRIDDPATQSRIADAVGAMTAALLKMPVGPLAEAMEDAAPGSVDPAIGPDTTLGELADADARDFAREARAQSLEVGRTMGRSARALASAMPALADAMRQFRGAMEGVATPRPDDFPDE